MNREGLDHVKWPPHPWPIVFSSMTLLPYRLVNSSATEVQRQISGCRWTDWRQQNNAFYWNDQRRQHDATSSVCGWTDQRQSHDASSLGWLTVGLVTCDGESACKGGLIDGGETMLCVGMIDNSNTRLLLPVAGGLINGRDMALLLSAGQRFGCLRAMANQRARVDWLMAATLCFFLVWSTAVTQPYF